MKLYESRVESKDDTCRQRYRKTNDRLEQNPTYAHDNFGKIGIGTPKRLESVGPCKSAAWGFESPSFLFFDFKFFL